MCAGFGQRADKERKLLVGQVNELKGELTRRGSPKTLLNNVTSTLSEFKAEPLWPSHPIPLPA